MLVIFGLDRDKITWKKKKTPLLADFSNIFSSILP